MDGRQVREVAKALMREIERGGHFCLHGEDWGRMKTVTEDNAKNIKALRDEIKGMRDELFLLRDEVSGMRGATRIKERVFDAVCNLASAAIGALLVIVFTR